MPMVRYQATQMFPWPGKLPLMRTAVEHQRDAASADVDVRKLDLNLATTIAQAVLGRYYTGIGGHHEVARAQVEVNALAWNTRTSKASDSRPSR